MGAPGQADGTGTAASFKAPSGIAADSAGNIYVADTQNHTSATAESSLTASALLFTASAGHTGFTPITGTVSRAMSRAVERGFGKFFTTRSVRIEE